jgi:hypothetical protein
MEVLKESGRRKCQATLRPEGSEARVEGRSREGRSCEESADEEEI